MTVTATARPATDPAESGAPVLGARAQTTLRPDQILHSGNSGMIIHRVGQLKYEFADEGRGFSVDLLNYINHNQVGVATTFCYEELFGVRDRIHWFIHLRNPNEYRKLVKMVDHDEKFGGRPSASPARSASRISRGSVTSRRSMKVEPLVVEARKQASVRPRRARPGRLINCRRRPWRAHAARRSAGIRGS